MILSKYKANFIFKTVDGVIGVADYFGDDNVSFRVKNVKFTNAPNGIIPNIVEANVPYQDCINIMKSNIIWYKYKEKKNY